MIDSAIAALKAGDPDTALTVLVGLWRETRSTALADAIDQISAKVFAERGPLTGPSIKERDAEWTALLASHRAGDFEMLLNGVMIGATSDAERRLIAMGELPPDPRLATALISWLSNPPRGFRGEAGRSFWRRAIDVLVHVADPRTTTRFPAAAARWKTLRIRDEGRFAAAGREWVETPVDFGSLPQFINATKAPRDAKEALDAVYRAPDDLLVRQVCADVLVEAGDARGELIALGLLAHRSRAQTTRYRELLKTCGELMLGPLAQAFLRGGLEFAHGFPSAGRVKFWNRTEADALIDRPEWSTFVSLEILEWSGPVRALVEAPAMRSLKSLIAGDPSVIESKRLSRLETLQINGYQSWARLTEFMRGETMPQLRSLSVHASEEDETLAIECLEGSALFARLESFELQSLLNEPGPLWLPFLSRAPVRLRNFTLRNPYSKRSDRFTRDDSGAWVRTTETS